MKMANNQTSQASKAANLNKKEALKKLKKDQAKIKVETEAFVRKVSSVNQ